MNAPLPVSSAFWEELFDLVREQKLVPVVGPDLLNTQLPDGSQKNFYTHIAEKLASKLRVAPPQRVALASLNEVACSFLADQGQSPDDLHPTVARIIHEQEATFPLSDALLKIAQLPVKLFVTTTSDRLLLRAIETSQPQWKGRVRVVEYSPVRPEDFPFAELEEGGAPIVFHLFGRASATPEYVVTEEDALEFMHALHSQASVLRILRKANLLVVGCGFPDWMARFFIRLGRPQRLSSGGGKKDWFVGDSVAAPELVAFIVHYSHRTRYLPLSGEQFAAALSETLPVDLRRAAPTAKTERDPARDIKPGSVFISFASEDRAIVERIYETLQEHLDCWFDSKQLEAGDDWEQKIARNVEECYLFIPVISQHTLIPKSRFFREEWKHAVSRSGRFPPNRKFLLPVAIDDTRPNDPALDLTIGGLQWTRLEVVVDASSPGRAGVSIPDAFIKLVKDAYEAAQASDGRSR